MSRITTNKGRRKMRHRRVRRKIQGTAARPRLAVYRSLNHIYAQIVDDAEGMTMASASSIEPGIRTDSKGKVKTAIATEVGVVIGQRAKDAGVSSVVFDRGGYKFHGRVKALAEAAREGGLIF